MSPKNLRNLPFFLSQKLAFLLICKFADLICVTSTPDIEPFIKAGRKKEDIFVIKGGINYQHLHNFQMPIEKIYDAVFIGRFHPQKGVTEMIDIWREVVKVKNQARLAIIGLGDLEDEMKKRIRQYKIENNVEFLGWLLDDRRNEVIQKSKVILHPAIYDSGGMAAALGLACGLPGVCFDLPVFNTYYPLGFLKAKVGDIKDFSEKILDLLNNKILYQKMREEAIVEAKTWDWEIRLKSIIKAMQKLKN